MMENLGKILIGIGILLILVGVLVLVTNRVGIHLGRLPGDLIFRRGSTTIYIPIITSLLISLLLTLILWLFRR
jgi:hypothetical protein